MGDLILRRGGLRRELVSTELPIANKRHDFSRLRTPGDWFIFLICTAGGAGISPWAPGTFGTLVGVPLVFLTMDWAWAPKLLFWGILFLVGIWASRHFDELMNARDSQSIVIDEVVGYGITAWFVHSIPGLIIAFAVFRVFDVIKPFPIRSLDRWSKKRTSPWWSGFGVMADDLLAGIYGLIAMILLSRAGFL